jgi:uncharacterized protein (UPF0297 family)
LQDTIQFQPQGENHRPEEVLRFVYQALQEKGYNPVHQLVGYLLSGDTSYIPRHNQARTIIRRVERDELLEELVRSYFQAGD